MSKYESRGLYINKDDILRCYYNNKALFDKEDNDFIRHFNGKKHNAYEVAKEAERKKQDFIERRTKAEAAAEQLNKLNNLWGFIEQECKKVILAD